MTWIRTVGYEESEGQLRDLYERLLGPDGQIDNILRLHSLRPHTLQGHLALYKAVLHHSGNRLPIWLLEALGVYVSLLNDCSYCVLHHLEGLRKQLDDEDRYEAIREALERRRPEEVFGGRETAMFRYAEGLTLEPAVLTEASVEKLRQAGLEDGEILEVNQVVAYFAYANRTVLGLGASSQGEILGLSPGNEEKAEDWRHS